MFVVVNFVGKCVCVCGQFICAQAFAFNLKRFHYNFNFSSSPNPMVRRRASNFLRTVVLAVDCIVLVAHRP